MQTKRMDISQDNSSYQINSRSKPQQDNDSSWSEAADKDKAGDMSNTIEAVEDPQINNSVYERYNLTGVDEQIQG